MFPFTLTFLLLYATVVHFKRAVRMRGSTASRLSMKIIQVKEHGGPEKMELVGCAEAGARTGAGAG